VAVKNMFLEISTLGYAPRPAQSPAERRARPRRRVQEDAELVIPAENLTLPCRVLNISADGAGIACDLIPRAGAPVRLILREGRTIDAVTAWFGKGQLGLKFTDPLEG
jgi:hypothetical protein